MLNLIQNFGVHKMEITHIPEKSLQIQTICKIPLETLVMNQALSGSNLMWLGDGILISFSGYASTDKTIHEQIQGIYNWVLLEYTYELKSYKPTLKADKLNREVAVYDMSHNPFYQDVAKFIRSKEDK